MTWYSNYRALPEVLLVGPAPKPVPKPAPKPKPKAVPAPTVPAATTPSPPAVPGAEAGLRFLR